MGRKINVLIHTYEPYIVLPRAIELTEQNADPELMFHEWNNRNDAGQITNSIDINPTVEEVLDSFKGKVISIMMYLFIQIYTVRVI